MQLGHNNESRKVPDKFGFLQCMLQYILALHTARLGGDLQTDSLHVMEWLTCDPLGHGIRDNYVRVLHPIFSITGVVIISLAIISKP